MPDVNLLPDELREKEVKEQQKPSSAGPIQMSTPLVDEARGRSSTVLPTRKPLAPFTREEEDHFKHLREASYISVDKSGHIIHETNETEPSEKVSWWRRLFGPRLKADHSQRAKSKAVTPAPVAGGQESTRSTLPVQPIAKPMPAKIAPRRPGFWQRLFGNRSKTSSISAAAATSQPVSSTLTSAPSSSPKITPPNLPPSVGLRQNSAVIKESAAPAPVVHQPPPPVLPGSATTLSAPSKGPDAKAPGKRAMYEPSHLGPPPIGINLIPQEWLLSAEFSPILRLRILGGLIGLSVIVLLGSLAARQWLQYNLNSKIQNLESQKISFNKLVDDLADEEAEWQQMLASLTSLQYLLANHVDTLPVWRSVEQATIPEVRLLSLDMASQGVINLQGETSSYELLARQIKSFEKMSLSPEAVNLKGFTFESTQSRLDFELTINFDSARMKYVP